MSSIVSREVVSEMEKCMREYALYQVERCSKEYNFDYDSAKRMLSLEDETYSRENRRSIPKKKSVEKKITLPYSASGLVVEGCQGLAYNQGLYTQCQKKRVESGTYCNVCLTESLTTTTGVPICGTVSQRQMVGLMEYRDTKNRKPVAYLKIMEKNGWSREHVETEAGKLNYLIDEQHYLVEGKNEKVGRPKVEKKRAVKAETVEDLFAK